MPDIMNSNHKPYGLGVENGQLGQIEYTNVQTRIVIDASDAHASGCEKAEAAA